LDTVVGSGARTVQAATATRQSDVGPRARATGRVPVEVVLVMIVAGVQLSPRMVGRVAAVRGRTRRPDGRALPSLLRRRHHAFLPVPQRPFPGPLVQGRLGPRHVQLDAGNGVHRVVQRVQGHLGVGAPREVHERVVLQLFDPLDDAVLAEHLGQRGLVQRAATAVVLPHEQYAHRGHDLVVRFRFRVRPVHDRFTTEHLVTL